MRVSLFDDGRGDHDHDKRAWWVEVMIDDAPAETAFGAVCMFNFDAATREDAEMALRKIGHCLMNAKVEDGILTAPAREGPTYRKLKLETPF